MSKVKPLVIICLVVLVLWLLVGWVFPGDVILPQNFSLLGLRVQYYGLIMGLAVLCAYALALHRAKEYSLAKDQVESIALAVIIGGFIGARLYHVASSWEYYLSSPSEIIMVWNGGLSIFGAVFGGLFALWLMRRYLSLQMPMTRLLDWLVPSLVLGQIIGRFGNLFNYEAYGAATSLPWALFVPEQFRMAAVLAESYFHPLFLYEALAGLLILVILLNFSSITTRWPWLNFDGHLFWFWVASYGFVRIFTEYLRLDSPYLGPFKQNLLVAVVMLLIALAMFLYQNRRYKIVHESQST
jgi:phosphatidylglycerol---prolipoprotein diacylglyceryl transferase